MSVDLVTTFLSAAALVADAAASAADAAGTTFTPSRFAGRLHPILVHFPIALVSAAAAIEAWRFLRRERGVSAASAPLLTAAALTALAATGSGWLNAAWEHGSDASDHLARHRWLGTIIAVALVGIALIAVRARRQASTLGGSAGSFVLAQRLGALGGAAIVGLVGHLGGELVHGEDYLQKGLLSRPSSGSARHATGAGQSASSMAGSAGIVPEGASSEDIFFLTKIQPIFAAHCEECHGAEKQKGGLRLVPVGAAFDGPADKWVIVERHPELSELINRVTLLRDDPDAMPPKGDGLSEDEIKLLERWIRDGAYVPASERAASVLERPATTTDVPPKPTAAIERSIEQCVACGAIAQPIYGGAPLFEVNASRATPPWSDAQLSNLLGACDAIAALNLAHSHVTDTGLASLPPMAELLRLRLDETSLGDAAIEPLLACGKLSSINLVGTSVSDAGLERLLGLPSLRQVYVWRSKVTPAGVERAARLRPDVEIVDGAGR